MDTERICDQKKGEEKKQTEKQWKCVKEHESTYVSYMFEQI